MEYRSSLGRKQKQPDPFKRNIPVALRAKIWAMPCAACGSNGITHIDHIIPFSKGGTSHEENLQALCRRCNNKKGNRLISIEDLRKEVAWRARSNA